MTVISHDSDFMLLRDYLEEKAGERIRLPDGVHIPDELVCAIALQELVVQQKRIVELQGKLQRKRP